MSKLNITLLVISALLAVCLCFENEKFQLSRDEEVDDLNGYEAYAGQYPWYALIRMPFTVNFTHTCGGTIISSQWIMTEAYCFDRCYFCIDTEEFHVYIGSTNYTTDLDPSEAIISNKVIMHPLYNTPNYLSNNIALIQLPIDIELGSLTVNAITLPWNLLDTDLTMVQTHFVAFKIIDEIYEQRWNNLQLITDEECSNLMTEFETNDLCTLGTSTNELQTPCGIIDGTALAFYSNNTWTQIAIGSIKSCGLRPSRFTRVTLFLEWITTVTGISG